MTLEGKTIDTVREMTDDELERSFGPLAATPTHANPVVLVLDDGTEVFPSMDSEGNGAGQLFGHTPEGDEVAYFPTDERDAADCDHD